MVKHRKPGGNIRKQFKKKIQEDIDKHGKTGGSKRKYRKIWENKNIRDTWKNIGTQGNTGNKGRLINNILEILYIQFYIFYVFSIASAEIKYS